jgi:UTP--glucose-1-phosphate uridylyltransferase
MVEKPHEKDGPSNMAIIARYFLKPYTFNILKNAKPKTGEEIQITDALLQKAKHGNVIAYKFKGKRVDCGSLEGIEKSYVKL